jgi:hypothetical protein
MKERQKKTGERRNTDPSTAPDVTKTMEKHEYLHSTATSSCLSYTEAKKKSGQTLACAAGIDQEVRSLPQNKPRTRDAAAAL